jgi:putative ABC transport system permease protein
MIRHLLKIVWNRKRVNGLILTEITLSFLVLFGVAVMATLYTVNYRKPLGFRIERVWSISVETNLAWGERTQEKLRGMDLVTRALREMPEIEAVGGIGTSPYSTSTSIGNRKFEGREVEAHMNEATDETGELLEVDLIAGRWFSREDDGAAQPPAVINERLAMDLYGTTDVVGKETPYDKSRVVGVVRDFRKAGEFSNPVNYFLSRIRTTDTASHSVPWDVLIRVKPGTTAEFQEKLVKTLEAVQKGWTFRVTTLDRMREANFREHLAPLIAGGIVAGFLLFMVALGLIGVLWQNVSQRTREIGIRRAVGGTANAVYRQILGELVVLTTIGLAIGTAVVIQLPLLDLISDIPAFVYAVGFTVSVLLMYTLTFVCGFYPSWLTMEVRPAEALHYE